MFENAKQRFADKKKSAETWDDFMIALNHRCIVYTPW